MLSWIAGSALWTGIKSAPLTLSQWLAIGKLVAILVLIGTLLAQSSQIHHWHTKYDAEHSARAADRQSYERAQADAQAKNKAQVQQIEQTYQRNSDDERLSYLSDLAKLRAQRVRQSSPAPQGGTGPATPPAPDTGTPRIDETGLCVPATSDVCEAGAEIELRLMHIQNLYEQQTKINPNTGASR